MSCKTCFSDWVCKCVPYNDVIVINTNVPAGLYEYEITGQFEEVYRGIADRASDGKLEIPIADFPDGFFSEFGGAKTLEIYEYGGCSPISIPLGVMVNCIDIEVKGGTSEKNTIGCDVLSSVAVIGVFTTVFSNGFL